MALILLALVVEQPQLTIPQLTLKSHGILFYMGLCGSVLAYVFWLKGVQQLGPDKSAIAFNLVPVFTLLVSLILGVMPNALQVGGLVLVLFAVLVFNGKVALPSARKAEAGLGR